MWHEATVGALAILLAFLLGGFVFSEIQFRNIKANIDELQALNEQAEALTHPAEVDVTW